MQLRQLGKSELRIPRIVIGGNVFGWTIDRAQSFRLLDAFVDAGLNAIDTADVYSAWVEGNKGGESETIIGEWIKQRQRRDDLLILSKVGAGTGLSKSNIAKAIAGSLQRLQTEYLDLYQSHVDDAETPLEETLSAFGELIQQGKVRAIGASNYSAERLQVALDISQQHNLPRYESLQPLYNLYDRDRYEGDVEAVCQQADVGVIPYSTLASGFLTGKYRSEADLGQSARGSRVRSYLNERGWAILKALDEVAAEFQATPGQVALAWQIARPSITAPIASATNLDQVNDLINAAKLELTAAAVDYLNQAGQ
ncbi:aldo/keto reductase [Herpetosiphon giganteus]|uniref:aldo/keto reductase n=1 Tax=Herpetosiphon giganteus TaxID=2029754 RepID=UPI0019569012|nr:aldo/keto reductase [Herpetosiphon giganteus]MBM7845562.1 aryl-alcohol dehydrogenase-like predicted oxidoreductase [Herpetosiphon giganteus]